MSSSSSTSSARTQTASSKSKRRRWTKEELLKTYTRLSALGSMLPPVLPPSPPASRAASPAPGSKRKLDASSDLDSAKRPRTGSNLDRQSHQPPHSSQQPVYQSSQARSSAQLPQTAPSIPSASSRQPELPSRPFVRSEPCEDGEVPEDRIDTPAPSRGSPDDLPVARPRFQKPSVSHFEALWDRYHQAGRQFKYSGDARYWAAHSTNHTDYRPLANPPPVKSQYHIHAQLIARLELLDALICFTYSLWNKDYGRSICNSENWTTLSQFLAWCKKKWHQSNITKNDSESALSAVIPLIEGAIHMRQLYFGMKPVREKVDKVVSNLKAKAAAISVSSDLLGVHSSVLDGKTPPMLPSPNSANSTPVNREDATPNNSSSKPAATNHQPNAQPQPQGAQQPLPPHVVKAMSSVTEPIDLPLAKQMQRITSGWPHAAQLIKDSQQYLNRITLRNCFPKTERRIYYSNLTYDCEYIPDMEDDCGELCWPDNFLYGEGLGWVCLLGRAMIREYGSNFGYKGLDGVVPKPKPEDELNKAHPQYSSQRPGPPPGQASSHRHAPSISR